MGLPSLVSKEAARYASLPGMIRDALDRGSGDAVLYEVWVSRAAAVALAASARLSGWPTTSALLSIGEEILRIETVRLEAMAVGLGLNPLTDKPSTSHYRLARHVFFSASSTGPAPALAVAYARARLREAAARGCNNCGVWGSKEFSALAARVAHTLEMTEFLDLNEVIGHVGDYLLVETMFYSSIT